MKTKFKEHGDVRPSDKAHYQFKKLSASEKLTVRIVYWKKWRRFVRRSRLSRNQAAFVKLYFYEIHTRYYHTVVKGGSYVTTPRLIRNFFLSKANENLRTVVAALLPYNLTAFVQGVRSQIEINALLYKFLKDPEYHKAHITLNEDRRLVKELKTTININTLVDGLDSSVIPYQAAYHSLSLLLHPNPSAIKFYAQAEGTPTEDSSGVFRPKIKYYFDKTVSHTENTAEWFSEQIWFIQTCVEHFLMLFDELKNEFYLNEHEQSQHAKFAMAQFVALHEKEILQAFNEAHRRGEDPDQAVNKAVGELLKNAQKGDEQ